MIYLTRSNAVPAMRWLLTIIAALSSATWLLSYWWEASLHLRIDDCVAIWRGCLMLSYDYRSMWADHQGEPTAWIGRTRPLPTLYWGSFEWSHPTDMVFALLIPLWALALASGVPAAWLWMRRRRLRPIDCQKCGYDLAATPGISKCPECGQPATQSRGEASA